MTIASDGGGPFGFLATFFADLEVLLCAACLWVACAWCLAWVTVARAWVTPMPDMNRRAAAATRSPTILGDVMTSHFVSGAF